jgi:hypothetical protein
MRGLYKVILVGIALAVAIYFILGYLSSYVGWEGYKKWEYRVATAEMQESKRRGVFVKELNFVVEHYPDTLKDFKPYIERGFKYGRHSSEETTPLTGSGYRYQLSFNFKTSKNVGLLIMPDELKKFNSCDAATGYLASPRLKDTIIVNLVGEYGDSGIVKVWE